MSALHWSFPSRIRSAVVQITGHHLVSLHLYCVEMENLCVRAVHDIAELDRRLAVEVARREKCPEACMVC